MAGKPATDHIVWIDRGWQPVSIGFCPSKKAWRREMRRIGQSDPYPKNAGRASFYRHKGSAGAIVTLGDHLEEAHSRVEIAGVLAHESTHVWQYVRDEIGEEKPSPEFEAYAVQAIFQQLYQAWLDTRAPDEMKAACAKRVKAKN